MNIYGHIVYNYVYDILYIIIYWCLRDCYVLRLFCFFFRFLFFET